jgi:hypothetical protein
MLCFLSVGSTVASLVHGPMLSVPPYPPLGPAHQFHFASFAPNSNRLVLLPSTVARTPLRPLACTHRRTCAPSLLLHRHSTIARGSSTMPRHCSTHPRCLSTPPTPPCRRRAARAPLATTLAPHTATPSTPPHAHRLGLGIRFNRTDQFFGF